MLPRLRIPYDPQVPESEQEARLNTASFMKMSHLASCEVVNARKVVSMAFVTLLQVATDTLEGFSSLNCRKEKVARCSKYNIGRKVTRRSKREVAR